MANRRFIDFPIAASVGDNDIVLIWQDGLNKQTTKATLFAGSPNSLAGLTDVDISALANGQILQYNSTTSKWENVDRTDIDLDQLGDVTIVSPTNGQVLVYNSSTSKWENSSAGFVPYTGAVTTVNLGAQSILAGSFVKAGGTSSQFLKADGSVDSNTYLTTGSAAATYVPYTGATADVNLGTHDLTAERGTFANNGSSDTLTVNHTSGSGIGVKVTKGGNNEALLVTKTSGSGNAMAVVGGRTALVDLSLSSVSNATGNFLTISGGVVHQRTASETRSDVGAQAQLNGTGFVKASGTTITYDNSTYQVTSDKGQPNGYASLDSNGKVPLTQINDALIGNVNYQGLWNASTNTPTLANPPSSGTKGYYYIVSTAGTFAGISFEVGDWIISSGSAWQKIDNTDAVSSVFGRTGNVVASNGDYTTAQVTESGNLYYTEARVNANTNVAANTAARHNAVTLGTANGLSLSTQVLSLGLASAGVTGALSGTDWSTFNNKQNALTNPVTGTGSAGQVAYWSSGSAITGESNLFWDATNDRLGIGNNSPSFGLDIQSSVSANAYLRVLFTGFAETFVQSFSDGGYLGTNNDYPLFIRTNNVTRLTIANSTGAATFSSSVTATSIIRTGGTSSQYLMADGSVSTLTNPVTGTGTAGQVAYWNGTTTQTGDSKLTFNSSTGLLTLDGNLTFTGPHTISTSTGNLTLATAGGNGNILLSPNGTGNLGIGTATPNTKLEVVGDSFISDGLGVGVSRNFVNSGPILTTSLTNGGSGYVDGTYVDVPVVNGDSVYARFTIVVSGGIVTTATLIWGGSSYRVGETLSILNTSIGGSGSGLVITVLSVDSSKLIIVDNNGGDITLYRNDTSLTAADNIGSIKFEGRDSTLKASGIYAKIGAFARGANGGAFLSFFTSLGSGGLLTEQWRITTSGNLQSQGAQTIETSTGALTLQPSGGVNLATSSGNVLIGTTTDNGSKLRVNGSVALPHVTKSANYTLDNTDYTVGFDCASNRTATLPDATTCAGRIYVIYHYNTNFATRSVTLDGSGSQTIDGVTTYNLIGTSDFSSVMIQSNGSNWIVLADKLYYFV